MAVSDNVEQIVEQINVHKGERDSVDRRYGHYLSERFHAIAFWFLIVALFGACAGVGIAFKYHSAQLDRTVQIGSFVHKDVVYEVKPRNAK